MRVLVCEFLVEFERCLWKRTIETSQISSSEVKYFAMVVIRGKNYSGDIGWWWRNMAVIRNKTSLDDCNCNKTKHSKDSDLEKSARSLAIALDIAQYSLVLLVALNPNYILFLITTIFLHYHQISPLYFYFHISYSHIF